MAILGTTCTCCRLSGKRSAARNSNTSEWASALVFPSNTLPRVGNNGTPLHLMLEEHYYHC